MPWTSMPIAEQPITTHHRRVDCNEGPTSHQESEAIGLVGTEELAPGSICGPEPSSVCAQCHKLREPEEPNYSRGHSTPILCEACYRGGTSSSCPSRPSDDSKATESRKSRPQERGKAASDQVGPVPDGCRVYPLQHWCEVWRCRASRSTVSTQCRKETDLNCWHCMRYVCTTHLGFPTGLCGDCYLSLGRDLSHTKLGGPPGGSKPDVQANGGSLLCHSPPLISHGAIAFINYPDQLSTGVILFVFEIIQRERARPNQRKAAEHSLESAAHITPFLSESSAEDLLLINYHMKAGSITEEEAVEELMGRDATVEFVGCRSKDQYGPPSAILC